MSNARTHARNLAFNWLGHGANMVLLFFLSPFVIHTLGKGDYGLWSLLNVLTGYMGILDLGVRASTGRHITLYVGKGDLEKVDHTIRTALGFFSVVGLFLLAIGAAMGWVFPSVFTDVSPSDSRLMLILLPIMAGNMWLSTYGAVFSSVLVAHDRFDLTRMVDLIVLGVRTVGTILVLNAGYGLLGLALVTVLFNVLAGLGNFLLARRVHKGLKVFPLMLHRDRVKELMGYGFFAFLGRIGHRIIGQTDLILVGIVIASGEVTTYSVGAMLIYYSSPFLNMIASTFFPPVQRAIARGELGSAKWLYFRQIRLGMIFGVLVYVGCIFFAEQFIHLWMYDPVKFPESSVRNAALVMQILAASKLLLLVQMGAGGLLAAMGHIRFGAFITLAEAGTNLALSLFFAGILGWGLAGIALGTLVARLLVSTFILPWYTCKIAKIDGRKFAIRIVGMQVVACGLFAAVCYAVRSFATAPTWLAFGVQVAAVLTAFVPIALFVIVPADDRRRLWRRVRSTHVGVQ